MVTSYELIERYISDGDWRKAAAEAWHISRRSASRAKRDRWETTAREYAIKAGYPAEAVDEAIGNDDLYTLLSQEPQSSVVIVTRHAGAVEWLRQKGYTGEVIDHIDSPSQVTGKIVIGNVPLHLAAVALQVWAINMLNLRPDQRGKDLSPTEMDNAGAEIHKYRVIDLGKKEMEQ